VGAVTRGIVYALRSTSEEDVLAAAVVDAVAGRRHE